MSFLEFPPTSLFGLVGDLAVAGTGIFLEKVLVDLSAQAYGRVFCAIVLKEKSFSDRVRQAEQFEKAWHKRSPKAPYAWLGVMYKVADVVLGVALFLGTPLVVGAGVATAFFFCTASMAGAAVVGSAMVVLGVIFARSAFTDECSFTREGEEGPFVKMCRALHVIGGIQSLSRNPKDPFSKGPVGRTLKRGASLR